MNRLRFMNIHQTLNFARAEAEAKWGCILPKSPQLNFYLSDESMVHF